MAQTDNIKDRSFGALPEMVEIKHGKQTLYGYPALVDKQTRCDIGVFDDPGLARNAHRLDLKRLFALPMRETTKALHKQLPGARDLGLLFMSIGNADTFKERFNQGKPKLALIAQEVARHTLASLQAYADLQKRMTQLKASSGSAHADVSSQIQQLIHQKFVANTTYEYLVHLPK